MMTHMKGRAVFPAASIGLALLLLAPAVRAQPKLAEGFDDVGPVLPGQNGPANLIQNGWMFRNQSSPKGAGTWFAGYPSYFPPRSGSGYLAVDSLSTDYFGGDISQWALLPAVTGQQAGDWLTFYVRRMSSSNDDVLQVRYSPSGGTSTGSGVNDVGDYTVLLAELHPIPLTGWTAVSRPVPGGGRLALRYVVADACNFACFASYVGIDELAVDSAAPAGPPLPAPGETVHWTAAISPVVIEHDTAIVAGGTVIVDPGVEVRVQSSATLYVLGAIRFDAGGTLNVSGTSNVRVEGSASFLGTAAAPVTLTGGVGGVFAKGVEVASGGTVQLDHVVSDLPVYVYYDVVVYGEATNTIVIDHSAFVGDGDVRSLLGSLAIRRSSFAGPTIQVQESFLLIDAVTLDGSVLSTERRKAGQPVYLENLTAQNVAGEAPFLLGGFDYFFGPGNVISSNLYPVHLVGGGIAPGSTLPLTGNTNNYVHAGAGEAIGTVTFASAGLPYRIDFDPSFPTLGGQLTVEPGVHVRFGLDAELFLYAGGRLVAEGTSDAPIVFESLTPGVAWWGLAYDVVPTRPKLEDCIVRGAEGGVIASRCNVRLESVRLEDNLRAARVSGAGVLYARKCQFLNNDIGVQTSPGAPPGFLSGTADLTGTANPNSFAGNGVALEVQDPLNIKGIAPDNWWGDPTGPQHPTNPGGLGDPVSGLATVVPFRSSPPNFADHPPVVRLIEPYFLLEEGRKVILRWTAEDDHAIAFQRILYSPHSENPPLAVLIDNLPPGQRSVELTVPQCPPSSNNAPPVLRVVALDDAGQEGWDEAMFATPYIDFTETVTPDPMAGEFRPGQRIDVCYAFSGGIGGTVDVYLLLDGDEQAVSLGGGTTYITCLPLGLTVPPVSTDTARIATRFDYGAGGRSQWAFTDYFRIRPDPAIGDAPPTVTLLTPPAGASYPGGTVVPITWSAGDDEGVRSFSLQASYDGGRTWHFIARDLVGTSTGYNWPLPASAAGIPDVRVRVIARDVRFQNTSDGAGRSFAILPGRPGDLNCDGQVNAFDIDPFVLALTDPAGYAAAYPNCDRLLADVNGDGVVDAFDIDPFVALLTGP